MVPGETAYLTRKMTIYWDCKIYHTFYTSSPKVKWKLLSHVWLFVTPQNIVQAGILEWVDFPFSRGPSQPRGQAQVSHIADGLFTSWATKEAQEYWSG